MNTVQTGSKPYIILPEGDQKKIILGPKAGELLEQHRKRPVFFP